MRRAVLEIGGFCEVRQAASLYETAPLGPAQPDFLNSAVLVSCALEPEMLLEQLLATERTLGRVRAERWGPRTIDLDILWIRGTAVDRSNLHVPHPGLTERAFAILPLLDVAPDASDPRTGACYRIVASALDRSGARRIDGSGWASITPRS
jgi:2-amino-4-hydroxy-6-hydroxymethyldihydropteridine diphosphokinase